MYSQEQLWDIQKSRKEAIFSNFIESDIIKGGFGSGRHAVYLKGGVSNQGGAEYHHKHGRLISVHNTNAEAKDKAYKRNMVLREMNNEGINMHYHVKPY